jgi:hypothetical protein
MSIVSVHNHVPRREAGAMLLDGVQVASTVQCAHCSAHWPFQPGSGRLRGWCYKCMAPLCGKPACLVDCVPVEAKIEFEEGKKNRYWDLIRERGLRIL